jgi:hypothetical protein
LVSNLLWLAGLSFAWPLLHLLVAVIRFGQSFEGGFAESLIFLPMGALTGATLLLLIARANTNRQKRSSVIGYLLATPLGFFGSLVGGLVLSPILGTAVFGGIPLLIGSLIGYWLGREKQRE